MNEALLTALILRSRWREGFCLPRYTPGHWWECDVFEVTRNGYFREYEIKCSRSDFKADAKKDGRVPGSGRYEDDPARPGCQRWTEEHDKKHDLLAAGSQRGPAQFWYVMPKGLIKVEELPPFAGLIEVEQQPGQRPMHNLIETEVVKAPRLHRIKCEPEFTKHARGVCSGVCTP